MATTHILNVDIQWFNLINNGKKIVEGRLNKGKFLNINKHDLIIFTSENDNFKYQTDKRVVFNIRHYNSFNEYLTQEGLLRTLPGIESIEDGINIYRSFYTEENEKKIWHFSY